MKLYLRQNLLLLTIFLDHNQEQCELKVVLAINGEEKTLYNDVVTDTDFPMTLSATETGEGIIHVYNDGCNNTNFLCNLHKILPIRTLKMQTEEMNDRKNR